MPKERKVPTDAEMTAKFGKGWDRPLPTSDEEIAAEFGADFLAGLKRLKQRYA